MKQQLNRAVALSVVSLPVKTSSTELKSYFEKWLIVWEEWVKACLSSKEEKTLP